ncbi:MAG: DUF3352 domain-containing protein, partial [Flavobacteriales bacterium]
MKSLASAISTNEVGEFISLLAPEWEAGGKLYDGVKIHSLSGDGKQFFYAVEDGLFISGYSSLIVEDAIRQLHSGRSVMSDDSFMKAYRTAGHQVDLRLYIRHDALPKLVAEFLNKSAAGKIGLLDDYADWTELDMKLKPNAIMLNGFTVKNDSTDRYLDVFARGNPSEPDIFTVLPHNTAISLVLSVEDFKAYYSTWLGHLQKSHRLFEYKKALSGIESRWHCNVQEGLLNWVGGDMCVAICESPDTNISRYAYVILETVSPEAAGSALDNLLREAALGSTLAVDSTLYGNRAIRRIPIPDLLGKALGVPFYAVRENYFTLIGDYAVFANSQEAIKKLLRDYESERSLSKDLHFNAFSDNLGGESNVLIYSNIARSINCLKAFANEQTALEIARYEELFRKFDGAAIQVSRDNGNMFYNNVYLNYNPVYKEETALLVRAELDTAVVAGPFLVINHYTHADEILVQDKTGAIYLISNTGKILWKRALPEMMQGGVHQIDVFRNGKLQMLFSSENYIWLIDRNGNDVSGFPIKLESPAANPVALFDYDKTLKYRMLIACRDKKIYNFDQTGRMVKGWNQVKTTEPVLAELQHTIVGGKDYIIAVDSSGKVYAVNRRGEKRLDFSHRLPLQSGDHFFIDAG